LGKLKTVAEYKTDYALAAAMGDTAGMEAAHAGAEEVRKQTGWSPGGEDGSQSVYVGLPKVVKDSVQKYIYPGISDTGYINDKGMGGTLDNGSGVTKTWSNGTVQDYLNRNGFDVQLPDVPGLGAVGNVARSASMWQSITDFFGEGLNYVVFGLMAIVVIKLIKEH
jgi:hypothetical protein